MTHGTAPEVRFLDDLQRLLTEGGFSATYKFAVLVGLADLAVETWTQEGGYRDSFTTRELAERVLGLYWPQVRPFAPGVGAEVVILKQNSGAQARILTDLGDLAKTEGTGPIEAIRRHRPEAYGRYVDAVEWKLVEMPLARLQNPRAGVPEFLYAIPWTVADVEPRGGRLRREVHLHQRGQPSTFINQISMKPGVSGLLARFHGLIRQLVEARWVLEVRKLNRSVMQESDLHEHLFGAKRVDLGRVSEPLRETQGNRCFYCDSRLDAVHVDHFLPWARHPENRLENLVVTHGRCNASKSDHLASHEHLDRWLERFAPASPTRTNILAVADQVGWPLGGAAALAIARHLYRRHPEDVGLWHAGKDLQPWTLTDIERRLASAVTLLSGTSQP